MTKQKMKLAVIALVVAFVGMNGCKRCYKCAGLWSWNTCYKGTDTLRFQFFSKNDRLDTLMYYNTLGYTCDSGYQFWHWSEQEYCIREKELKKRLELSGDTCYEKN